MESQKILETFLSRHGWAALNVTQQKCMDQGILGSKENFLVIAPTGGGKTGVAELVMMSSLEQEPPKRILYVAPLKALAESNLEEFRQHLPGRKVMALRERNALRDGEVVVALNEWAYKVLLDTPDLVRNFSVLILDELHIMYQPSRGHTVEKILMLAKRMGLRIICLSATIENKEELRSWLNAVLIEIPESQRPIPLRAHDFAEKDFVRSILRFDKPPVLIFRSTKRSAEATAKKIAEAMHKERGAESHLKTSETQEQMRSRMNIDMTDRLEELAACLSNGVAWHHADLPPGVRGYVEELYATRKIDYIVSTTTLAYGFDSPTRTVVIYDLMRYSGDQKMKLIGIHEFHQMAGRAGRPSKSEFNDGFVCGIIRSAGGQAELNRYRTANLEPVESHLGTVDDYYQKALMEFVYAGHESLQDIADIMASSFYRSKGSTTGATWGFYDPITEIRRHVTELVKADYVYALPNDRLRLSEVGEFIVKFQLDRLESFDLRVFSELNRYVKMFSPSQPILFTPQVVYNVAKITDTILPSNQKAVPEATEKLMARYGWRWDDKIARTALAIFGWIDLMAGGDIETRYGVQAEAIEVVTQKLADNGFFAFINLARLNGYKLDPAYDTLRDSLHDGVPSELVPLTNIRDIGRKRAQGIVKACDAIVVNTSLSPSYTDRPDGTPMMRKGKPFTRKGDRITGKNCLAFLKNFLSLYGDDDVKNLLQSEPGIGSITAERVLELLKGATGS